MPVPVTPIELNGFIGGLPLCCQHFHVAQPGNGFLRRVTASSPSYLAHDPKHHTRKSHNRSKSSDRD
jgi:hypothetical protein